MNEKKLYTRALFKLILVELLFYASTAIPFEMPLMVIHWYKCPKVEWPHHLAMGFSIDYRHSVRSPQSCLTISNMCEFLPFFAIPLQIWYVDAKERECLVFLHRKKLHLNSKRGFGGPKTRIKSNTCSTPPTNPFEFIYTRHSALSCKLRNNKILTLNEQVFLCAPLISSSINQSKSKNRVCNVTKETLYTVSCQELFFFAREKDREKKNIWKGTWYTCYYLLIRFVCLYVFDKVRKIKIQLKFVSTRIHFYWEHSMICSFSSTVRRLRDLFDFSSELQWTLT